MAEKELIQYVDPGGNVDDAMLEKLPEDFLKKAYRLMVFTRLWNTKALSLQRQGRMGTFASVRGQEASNIGMGLALGADDWFCPSFRENGTMVARGIQPKDLFAYWAGDERGGKIPEGSRVLPVCITVGSHLAHAAGIAMAAKIRGEQIAVLSSSGDGSTSQGDFHEALNFAGVYKLPVVFAIQNNQWAISIPYEKQTATETIAEKAAAYGITGRRVDGNDVTAVYLTVKDLLDRARSDREPALVELVTYRMDDHTTADDASRYRTKEMVEDWLDKDPLDRIRKLLEAQLGWDESQDTQLTEECSAEVEQAVTDFEASPHPDPADIFNYMYAEEPWHLREQREELLQGLGPDGR
jgi:pyruvate dehydrogenase E1 component alpha subunit